MERKQRIYKTIWEEVAGDIKQRILSGEIKQGERIKEADIAEEFGVSRGPIREAFRQLEQEGLIEYSSRKGCTVKKISAADSKEYYLLRANLENLAVKVCEGKFSEQTISKMEAIVEKMKLYQDAEDLLDIIALDQKFHELLVKECKMEKLYELWSTLDNANAIIFYALYHTRYSPRERLPMNHGILVDALRRGNVDEICYLLEDHYLIVSENLGKEEQSTMQQEQTA